MGKKKNFDMLVTIMDVLCCVGLPEIDTMPYIWDYQEYTLRKIMNRLWILYEREVPLRKRVRMTKDACLQDALDPVKIKYWCATDVEFRDLVDFFTARTGTCNAILHNPRIFVA